MIKHYRVDKMRDISLTELCREGQEKFDKADLPQYSRRVFGMFGGESVSVTLRCVNDMAGVIIDRFGKDVSLIPVDEEHFETRVDVTASGQFIGWVVSFAGGVQIVAPESVVERMRDTVEKIREQYK